MRTPNRFLLALGLSTSVAAFLLVVPAAAEETDEAQAMVTRLAGLRKAEDVSGLMEALGQTPDIYKSTENAGLRSKLRHEMGKVLKDESHGDARMAAVEALVALDDPKGAWKEMSKEMPSPKAEKAAALDLAVVKAAGQLAQKGSVRTLLDLAAKAKDIKLARAAAEALGGFHKDKRNRLKILEELLSLGQRVRPGTAPGKTVSKEAQERWEAVGHGILVGLNSLTAQKMRSFEDWEALYKESRKHPEDLFLQED